MLSAPDIASLLYLHLHPADPYSAMAERLGISKSTAHGSVQRLIKNRLVHRSARAMGTVAQGPALDFLSYGVPYAFAPNIVPVARGVVTGLRALDGGGMNSFAGASALVWPSKLDDQMGVGIEPLVPAAPDIVHRDPPLYRMLAIVDALRVGDAREREVAREALQREFTLSTP